MVERSSRPAKWTLDKIGIHRRTFYRWYDRYLEHGEDGLVDRAPHPGRVWNKIPDSIRAELLNMALEASGCDQANVLHKSRLLSDNGSSYISGELADYTNDNGMSHVRGAPYHPQTRGKSRDGIKRSRTVCYSRTPSCPEI